MRVRGLARALVLLVLVCAGAALLAQQPAAQQQPVFRTNADLVTVPVFVRSNGTPVAGLTPADFVLLDNGVRQKVESLSGESIGADITILVETSQSMKKYLGSMSEQVRRISAMLRPDDRLEVLGIDTYIEELLPLKRAAEQRPLGKLAAGGSLTSVNDALVAALLREPDKMRPHLVIAMTDTVDTMSMSDIATVHDIAKESGATLVIAWVTLSEEATPEPGRGDPLPGLPRWFTTSERDDIAASGTRAAPRARYWVPHHTPPAGRTIDKFDALKDAAESTGGALHPPGVFVDRTAAAIFNKVYDDYRHSYVLRYMPSDVAADGWHDITVTTPKFPANELRARRGYFVEKSGAAPIAGKSAPPKTPAGGIESLVAAGETGDYNATAAVVRQNSSAGSPLSLIKSFRELGNVFPATPRREFLVALQMSEAALSSSFPGVPPAGYGLLTRYAHLLPQVEGYDGFERYWRATALALAQAPLHPVNAGQLLKESLAKFPDEPRFVLAAAVLADQQWIVGDITSPTAPKGRFNEIVRLFDAAIALEPTRAEASVRKAWFLNRMGRHAEALALIESAKPDPKDAMLSYWRELFRGKILDDLDRPVDSIAAYRAALDIAPQAQSALAGLMDVFARTGQGRDARVIADAIAAQPANAADPWWLYWQADYRWFPALFSQLAEFAK